ncbi:heparin-binding hemagglutinin [Williamsia deligens]|uniref:Heparin-binding hemagglutinin n=1 Tax=Williamsia deligens TaxID=321325 RepID=A0ABW3G7K3_9NOCA|nr:heparin-binding hemagglutinin [Williamsia deligens]MCP2193104.1 heparin binding hemagglutinin HbhA [Williamsia deligens]
MSKNERGLATPIYAAVGAGDLALQQVNEVLSQLRERAESATETAQARVEETRERIEGTRERITSLPEDIPSNIEELRTRFTSEELRKVAEAYIEVATGIYNSLAERGEETVERLRSQPEFQENVSKVEKAYNDAVDLTEDALGTVSSQTRAVGERAAKLANLASGKVSGAAGTVEAKARGSKDSPAAVLDELKEPATSAPAKKSPAKKTTAKKTTTPAKKTPAKKTPAKKAPAKKTAN